MEQFETKLIDFINSNPLPFEAKWYVLRHVFGLVDARYKEQLEKIKATCENTDDESRTDTQD